MLHFQRSTLDICLYCYVAIDITYICKIYRSKVRHIILSYNGFDRVCGGLSGLHIFKCHLEFISVGRFLGDIDSDQICHTGLNFTLNIGTAAIVRIWDASLSKHEWSAITQVRSIRFEDAQLRIPFGHCERVIEYIIGIAGAGSSYLLVEINSLADLTILDGKKIHKSDLERLIGSSILTLGYFQNKQWVGAYRSATETERIIITCSVFRITTGSHVYAAVCCCGRYLKCRVTGCWRSRDGVIIYACGCREHILTYLCRECILASRT